MAKQETRGYWLMKSEPACFSFEDLKKAKDRTTPWDGVRNFQARNLLRDDIRIGDGVLFYHSSIKIPAIVGLARVVRDGYPDPTAWDPESAHFDPKSKPENPVWFMVDVRYAADVKPPVTRDDLKTHPVLSKMGVLRRGNRLSVMPVTAEEWRAVLALRNIKDPLGS
jgi:predicted RNA-binding protein with PUA-like domain